MLFEELIRDTVRRFAREDRGFSHYLVILEARRRCNYGEVSLSDAEPFGKSFRIQGSAETRLWVTDEAKKNGYSSSYNGNYYEWNKMNNDSSSSSSSDCLADHVTCDDSILGYVERKHSRGQYPTVKMVQSALKRGKTYRSIPCGLIVTVLKGRGMKIDGFGGRAYIFP